MGRAPFVAYQERGLFFNVLPRGKDRNSKDVRTAAGRCRADRADGILIFAARNPML